MTLPIVSAVNAPAALTAARPDPTLLTRAGQHPLSRCDRCGGYQCRDTVIRGLCDRCRDPEAY